MRRTPPLLLLTACILALPVWAPLLPRLRSHYVGLEDADHYGTQWFYWFVGRSLPDLGSLTHTDLFFHPFGKDVLGHTGANVLDALLAWPLLALCGPVLGYNLFVLAGLAAAAASFCLLAREFTTDRLAIGLGALLFAFHPYALYELAEGRPTQGLLALLPLFLWACWRSGHRAQWRWPMLAGLLLAAIGYQYWFYALFAGLACLALGCCWSLRPPAGQRRGLLAARFALIAGLAALLVSPVALPLLLAVRDEAVPGLLDTASWSLAHIPLRSVQGDPVALATWQPLLRAGGTWYAHSDGREYFQVNHYQSSWISIALVLAWLWRPGKLPRAPWLAMALLLGLLALGPMLVVGQSYLPNPVYIALAKSVGVLRRLWWPVRAYAWLALLVPLAATAALAQLRRPRLQAALVLGAALLWLLDLRWCGLAPFPAWSAAVPAGYRCLASGPPGALIELPHGYTQAHLYYQTAHGRPLLGGMAEATSMLEPQRMRQLRDDNSLLRALQEISRRDMPPNEVLPGDLQQLHQLGYRYLVLQKDAFQQQTETRDMGAAARSARLRRLQRNLLRLAGAPVYQDARLAIYAPWGDPPPCEEGAVQPDSEPRPRPLLLDELRAEFH